MTEISPKAYRRVVTGHQGSKAVVLSDAELPTYAFKTIPGFEQTYVWTAKGTHEADPVEVDGALPRSALPPVGGSLLQIVTFPPAASRSHNAADPKAIAEDYRARLPELAESFERDGSGMHSTPTIDYALLLDGELWLELDDRETVHLHAGDIVVQQATRHGWRNKSEHLCRDISEHLSQRPTQSSRASPLWASHITRDIAKESGHELPNHPDHRRFDRHRPRHGVRFRQGRQHRRRLRPAR